MLAFACLRTVHLKLRFYKMTILFLESLNPPTVFCLGRSHFSVNTSFRIFHNLHSDTSWYNKCRLLELLWLTVYLVIFRASQGHTWSFSHWASDMTETPERHPSHQRLSACCCLSLLSQIKFWTIRKVRHVEQHSFNSNCLWPFAQSPVSALEYQQRPTQPRLSCSLKVFKEQNIITFCCLIMILK